MKHSTVVPRDFSAEFHENPIGWRVVLPDGSLAVVRRFEEMPEGRRYRVQGVYLNMRFRKLQGPSWFAEDDLRLFFYTASINPNWKQS